MLKDINFDNIKIIKKLNAGWHGTIYLCKYTNKLYALKIQHILEKDRIKSYDNSIWCEIDLYNSINKMPKNDQLFFTKLYGYKIYDNCTHKQIRPFNLNVNNKIAQQFKDLDESKWCISFLIDYKGNTTLGTFLEKKYNKLKQKVIYSMILQTINIVMILYKKGYSHNDLHLENIMINKTDKKQFIFNKKNINYYGFQLSSIDYGDILHKKFHKRLQNNGNFLKDRKKWLLTELFYSIMYIIRNFSYSVNYCVKLNKTIPWVKIPSFAGLKLIFKNHQKFCNERIKKYIKLFPDGKEGIEEFCKYYDTDKKMNEILKPHHSKFDFNCIINRLNIEFDLEYPKLHQQYYGWCCETKWLLPKEECLQILTFNTSDALIKHFLAKII